MVKLAFLKFNRQQQPPAIKGTTLLRIAPLSCELRLHYSKLQGRKMQVHGLMVHRGMKILEM